MLLFVSIILENETVKEKFFKLECFIFLLDEIWNKEINLRQKRLILGN
jgi:hypothetical protein